MGSIRLLGNVRNEPSVANLALLRTSVPFDHYGVVQVNTQVDSGLMTGRQHVCLERSKVFASLKKLVTDQSGATVIEYALTAGFIGIALIGSLQLAGTRLVAVFMQLLSAL